jgi:hypothetical protein
MRKICLLNFFSNFIFFNFWHWKKTGPGSVGSKQPESGSALSNRSVADPAPGCLFDPWIQDPGSGMGKKSGSGI